METGGNAIARFFLLQTTLIYEEASERERESDGESITIIPGEQKFLRNLMIAFWAQGSNWLNQID